MTAEPAADEWAVRDPSLAGAAQERAEVKLSDVRELEVEA